MQIISIIALAISASGVLAGPPKPKPTKPSKPEIPAPVVQQITCNGGSPYCCTAEADGENLGSGGAVFFECRDLEGTCNSITVCCNNNVCTCSMRLTPATAPLFEVATRENTC